MTTEIQKVIVPEMDQKSLFLLGLNVLSKSLKLPCAVVKPQATTSANRDVRESSEEYSSPLPEPASRSASAYTASSLKRKRDSSEDSLIEARKEKRFKEIIIIMTTNFFFYIFLFYQKNEEQGISSECQR